MRGRFFMIMLALMAISCSKDSTHGGRYIDYEYGRNLKHDAIVLGERLDNPYKTENMARALQSLYPTKADRVELKNTDLYVRFLPEDKEQYDMLEDIGLHLQDHPMDYDILVEGDWYHDPDVPEGDVTWQYAVVPADFDFPADVHHEIIHGCYLSENDPLSKSYDADIDWDAVEREAYMMTGNSSMLADPITKASDKVCPSGRITIVDKHANGGKPFGVAGVQVVCNSFVKISMTYTDRDGYYTMPKAFSSDLRYRLIFKNEKGFAIGFNLVLLPASVSTLGRSTPDGVSMTVTEDSEEKLFKRCVVNNSAYDYFTRCASDDMNVTAPPSDLRIWLFYGLRASSSVMMHHGAVLSHDLISEERCAVRLQTAVQLHAVHNRRHCVFTDTEMYVSACEIIGGEMTEFHRFRIFHFRKVRGGKVSRATHKGRHFHGELIQNLCGGLARCHRLFKFVKPVD